MKKFAPLLAVALLAGCPDDPAPVQRLDQHAYETIQAWKANGNLWGAGAQTRCPPTRVSVYTTPQADLPNKCNDPVQLWGCLAGNTIWVAEETWGVQRTDYIIEHELRHWLGGCSYGSIDGAHADNRYWFSYRGISIRE